MKTVATAGQAAGQRSVAQQRGIRGALAWILTVAAAATAQSALAAGSPIQMTGVAAGAASIQKSGLKTTITAADRTIIDYSRFNIPLGMQVQFVQPSATAKVLNRINSVTPTRIDGQLSANGIVYFTNPSGIIFGPTSVVNVGQMFAAAGTISNEDFLGDINHFTQVTGGVANFGRIEANAVTLIGRQAANYGSIIAPGGVVTLAAGADVFLSEPGSNVMVKVTDAPAPATVHPRSDGTAAPLPAGPAVGMGSGDLYAMASMRAMNTGKIQASRVTIEAPKGLVAVRGTIDASSSTASGGTVTLAGRTVAVGGATINASGATGGGTIQVGGDFGGGGTVPTAQWTFVGRDTTLRADATASGNGGQVSVWADGSTVFGGTIYARALGATGDGGQAEVSGKEHLQITGHAVLTSADGTAGTLLLDPGSVAITHNAVEIGGGASNDTFTDAYINTQLGLGSLIISTANSTNGGAENLTVAADVVISWATANSLTLIGNNSLAMAGTITAAGTGGVTLTGGAVTVPGTISLTGGSFIASGTSYGATGLAETVTGNIDLNFAGPVALGNVDIGGNLAVTAGGNVSQSPGTRLTVVGTTSATSPGAISVTSTNNNFSTITASGTNVAIGDADDVVLGNVTATGTLQVTAAGAVTQTVGSAVTATGAATFTAPGRDVQLGNAANNFSTITVTALNVTINDSNALVLGDFDLGGTLTVTAGGNITQAPGTQVLVLGAASLTSPGVVTVGSVNNNFSTITVSGTNVTIGDADELVLGNVTATGTFIVTAAGDVTQTAGSAVLATGATTFTVPGRDVLLGNAGNNFSTVTATALNMTLTDTNALVVGNLDLAGTMTLTAGGNVSQAPGTQATVVGAARVTATGAVALGSVNNNFSTITVSGTNVTIGDADDVVLGNVAAAGTLRVTAAGDVTQTVGSAVTATGAATFTAPGRDVILGNAGNDFSTVTATALDMTLRDSSALVLGNLDLAGTLAVVAGGNISQAPGTQVLVAGAATLAGTGSVAVGSVNNNFSTITVTGTAVTIGDADGLVLGNIGATGALSITAAGDVTQTAGSAVTATGAATITAPGRDVTLANATNNFASVAVTGMNVTLRDAGALNLGASTVSGNLIVTTGAGGTLGQIGAVTVSGNTALAAGGGGTILLNNAGNNFVGPVTVTTGGNVTLVDTNALTLGNIAATGTLTATSGAGAALTLAGTQSGLTRAILTAGGAIVQTGGSVGAGTVNLAAGNGISGVSAGASGNDALAVATQNISATSGGAALVSIVNTSALTTTLTGLTTAGGQVKFRQAGGGALNATGAVSAAGVANGAGAGGAGGNVTFLASSTLAVAGITTSGGSGTTTGGNAGAITLNAGGPISLSGNLAAAGGAGPTPGSAGNVTLNQAALVANNVVITGHDVTFPSTVNSSGGAWALTINTSGLGTTSFGGSVGLSSMLGALTTNADGTTRLGGSVQAAGASFGDPLILTANSNMSITGGASFATINSDGTARSLSITQTGAGAISGAIGGISPLTAFTLAGGSMIFGGGTATTTLGQIWNTALTLSADTSLTGTTMVFSGSINSGGGAARSLTLLNSGAAAFNPIAVGGTAPLASLNVTGASNVILGGSIATVGDITFAGPVSGPTGGGGPSDILLAASSPTARIVFNGVVGGSAGAPGFRNFTTDTPGVVLFQGAANGVYATNLIEFKSTGRVGVPLAASAGKPDGDLTLAVNSGGTIRFAQNDKFTVFGNMAILAPGGTVRLGDLSAKGNITVTADSILLQNRDAAPNLGPTGAIADAGFDIVAGGTLAFSVVPVANPLLPHVSFATTTGLPGDDLNHTLGAYGLRMAGPIADSEFFNGLTLLDLVARGPTTTPITQSLAGALPWDAYGVRPERNVVISGIVRDTLHEMGVYARNLSDDELAQALVGFILADDSPKKAGKPQPRDFTVASNRLPLEQVLPAIASYEELFFSAKLDKNGKPILDAYGKPVRDHSKPEEENLKKLFEEAWKAYVAQDGSKATPEGFRRFLSASGNTRALAALDKLRDLILQVQGLGLTPMEVSVSRTILVTRVKPATLNVPQFSAAILGSALSPTAALPSAKPAI